MGFMFGDNNHLHTLNNHDSAVLARPVMPILLIFNVLAGALIYSRNPEMNALVTVGTSAAYVFRFWVCIAPEILPATRHAYFDTVVAVPLLLLWVRLLNRERAGTNSADYGSAPRIRTRSQRFRAETEAWRLPALVPSVVNGFQIKTDVASSWHSR